jgi:predicted  nucleic acid-binding Zn-ribbon protein
VTLRRCQGCGNFHDKKLATCPLCGVGRYGYNPHLYAAKLNTHLDEQKANALKRA